MIDYIVPLLILIVCCIALRRKENAYSLLLEGGAEYTVPTGIPYREAGFRAIDNVDGELTDLVTVEGTVDWLRPGIYPVSYSVTDSYGNTTQIIRRVEVAAAQRPQTHWPDGKTIYLTFDDGPGPYTERLLDILDAYGVKATFFVVNSEHAHLMKEITDRGHSIGIHSVTHDYGAVYASAEAYFEDLFAMQQIIYENTGVALSRRQFQYGEPEYLPGHHDFPDGSGAECGLPVFRLECGCR